MKVLTIGCFDVLHPGHLELLAGCRQLAGPTGKVLVGVNEDEFIVRYKGRPPRQQLGHRIEVLEALRDVDAVFVNVGHEQAGTLIDCVRPERLAVGDDWLDQDRDQHRYLAQLGVDFEWLRERSLTVSYLPRTRGTASSRIPA